MVWLTVREGEAAWVVVKRVCENLGIDHAGQFTKIKGLAWAVVAMIATTGPDGKSYEMLCLDLESLPELPCWLAIEGRSPLPRPRSQVTVHELSLSRAGLRRWGAPRAVALGDAVCSARALRTRAS